MRYEEAPGPERPVRRKKKKTHRLYAAVVLFLGAAIIAASAFLLFYVRRIEVAGNEYLEEQEILDAVQDDEYSINALYLLWKYASGRGTVPPCLDEMRVRLKTPWTVKVTVKEKPIVGCIQNGEVYDYFDKEGLVVLESYTLTEGLPCIEGIQVEEVKLYRPLKSGDTRIFEQILEISREVKKYGLNTDRIVCEGDVLCLYMGKVRVCLGKKVSPVQIAQISSLMEKIGDKEGTLHLENYSETKGTITFQEEPLVPEE